MNRLTPLIVRRAETFAPALQLELPGLTEEQHSELMDDLRLFATTFAAGFFFVSMLLV